MAFDRRQAAQRDQARHRLTEQHLAHRSRAQRAESAPRPASDAGLDEIRTQLATPHSWRERARRPLLMASGLVVAILAGGLIPLALAWMQGALVPSGAGVESPPVAVAQATPRPSAVATAILNPAAIPPVPTTLPVPTRGAVAAVGRRPVIQPTSAAPPAQLTLPTSAPTPLPTPTPEGPRIPTAEEMWQQVLLPELDGVWRVDYPLAISLLDAYLANYPDQDEAKDKLYAALVDNAQQLVDQGAAADAVGQLKRARALEPERAEAVAALEALTPTPTPLPAVEAPAPVTAASVARAPAPQSAPLPRPTLAPARPLPVPAARPAPAPPPPTPTKVPFIPPGGR